MLRFLRGEKGATMIEAALTLPLVLLLTFSIVDFGTLFFVYLTMQNGASQATRYAVTGNAMDDPDHPGTALSRPDSIKLAFRQATPSLTLPDDAFAFSHLAVGGSTWLAGTGAPNEIDKVTVTYKWDLMTPLLRPFFTNGQIVVSVESAMKNEGRFQ